MCLTNNHRCERILPTCYPPITHHRIHLGVRSRLFQRSFLDNRRSCINNISLRENGWLSNLIHPPPYLQPQTYHYSPAIQPNT